MTNRKTRILIADDHAVYRMGLVALLGTDPKVEVIGEAEDGESAVRLALKTRPDVVLMDILMPGQDGISATQELHDRLPEAKVLILTTSSTSDDLAAALRNGATGAINKSADNIRLLEAIQSVAQGKKYISDEIRRLIAEDPPAPGLSPRQAEILQSITRGLTTPEIALQLGISQESVKMHTSALFAKIGVANRTEAVAIALRKHLLKF